jgi:predicted NodU family carbamoyl transferase
MLTLGIRAFGRDSSVVLVDEASIVAAIEEEKLSRSAGAGGIPRLGVACCLEQANAKTQDVQIASFPLRPRISALREAGLHFRQSFSGGGPTAWIQSLGQTFRQVDQLRQMRHLYGHSGSFLFLGHHLCHAASAQVSLRIERRSTPTL